MIRRFFKLIKFIIFLAVIAIGINVYVIKSTESRIAASFDSDVDAVTLEEKAALGLFGADCIMVLDKGKIAEIGSHEELMAKNGIYRKIYDMQMTVEEEEAEADE